MRIVIIDTETRGLNLFRYYRIIKIGAIKIINVENTNNHFYSSIHITTLHLAELTI